jgi:hypothetical protein
VLPSRYMGRIVSFHFNFLEKKVCFVGVICLDILLVIMLRKKKKSPPSERSGFLACGLDVIGEEEKVYY